MPIYVSQCEKCGKLFDYNVLPSQRNEPQVCECGGIGHRNEEAEYAKPSSLDFEDHRRLSVSMGVTKEELESGAAYQRFPGAEFTPDGYMVIHNRQEKLLRMKQAGMVEFN
jgi:hypothetical protein